MLNSSDHVHIWQLSPKLGYGIKYNHKNQYLASVLIFPQNEENGEKELLG